LLSRPALDLQDVPLFYPLLMSATSHARQERAWMLHLLIAGLQDDSSFALLKFVYSCWFFL
jgi:hypothetical protein